MNDLSYGGDDSWALKREMTGNVTGIQGLTTNNGKQESCLPKQTVLATVQD